MSKAYDIKGAMLIPKGLYEPCELMLCARRIFRSPDELAVLFCDQTENRIDTISTVSGRVVT
jgi:hypothetical protein